MRTNKKSKTNNFKLNNYLISTLLAIILFFLIGLAYQLFISNKHFYQTFVGDTNISFLTEGQAIRKLQSKIDLRSKQKLQFGYAQGSFEIDISNSSPLLDYSSLNSTFKTVHSGTIWEQLNNQFLSLFFPIRVSPVVSLNLDKQFNTIKTAVEKPAVDAQLAFDEITTQEGTPSARIQIIEGTNGLSLNKEALQREVIKFILNGKYQPQLPLKSTPPKLTTEYIMQAKKVLENTAQSPIKLNFENSSWTLEAKQLLALLDLTSGTGTPLNKDKIYLYLERIAAEINQEVQEGLFEFNPATKKVAAFRLAKEGRKLNIDKTYQLLTEALNGDLPKTIALPVETVKPKIATSDINSLGIQELLGRGISNFAGSIPNRIYNINLTAQRLNGILIPPGEVFSFNNTVGEIGAATGFKQAYVIKMGRTVLDDGGGVCQDSTTLFRAVLNAGLPVLKRTAHAYRVGYYEQGFPPGLDATVFYPSVDFQFKNDTSYHILIQTYTYGGNTLYVDLYGTSDNRQVTLTKSVVTNQTPPPPELRQDDPTLPKGTVKQIDWAAWGATVSFSRTVTRNEEEIKETFKSIYKPWQAVYLVGTKE
ncbi:VanW family protein [Candidatus Daviesbacteria bacterium]|nr:VanW family protein [Candidatus Daviesbacteria bacterium]